MLCGDGGQRHLLVRGVVIGGVVHESELGLGEDFQADVAAQLGPFVVLFGEHGTEEADERVSVGEDADDVGVAADLPVESFGGCWTRSGATLLWSRR